MNTKLDFTKPIKTRDGRSVRILCTDAPDDYYPVVALVGLNIWTYTAYGKFFHSRTDERPEDLVQAKETFWVNIYPASHHKTRAKADLANEGYASRIACVEIEVGEGL